MSDAQLKSELLHCAALADALAGHLADRCKLVAALDVRVSATNIRTAAELLSDDTKQKEMPL